MGAVQGYHSSDSFSFVAKPNSTQIARNVDFLMVNSAKDLTSLIGDGLLGLAPNTPQRSPYTTLVTSFYN